MGLWIKRKEQMSFIKYELDKLVHQDHELRKIFETINFKTIALDFKEELKDLGRKGHGLELGVRDLFLQFYYGHGAVAKWQISKFWQKLVLIFQGFFMPGINKKAILQQRLYAQQMPGHL